MTNRGKEGGKYHSVASRYENCCGVTPECSAQNVCNSWCFQDNSVCHEQILPNEQCRKTKGPVNILKLRLWKFYEFSITKQNMYQIIIKFHFLKAVAIIIIDTNCFYGLQNGFIINSFISCAENLQLLFINMLFFSPFPITQLSVDR